jgi:hypothetical protein
MFNEKYGEHTVTLFNTETPILELETHESFEPLEDIDDMFSRFCNSPGLQLELSNCFSDSPTQPENEQTNDFPKTTNLSIKQSKSVTNDFDTSLLKDPIVHELAYKFIQDKEAYASAQQIINGVDNGCWVDQQPVPVQHKKQRGPKQDVPAHLKDEKYYRKRTNNTKAARRSRKRAKLRKALKQAAAMTGVHGDKAKAQVAEIKKPAYFHRTRSTTTV